MRTLSPVPATSLLDSRPALSWRLPRWVRVIVIAAAVVVALGVLFAARPPGMAIRGDLAAGASALRELPSNASTTRVTATLRSAMHGRSVRVDPSGFPRSVSVTLKDLDWRSCVAAETSARRLEGQVVVELQAFGSPDACRESNNMTWRFMP
jgi:hypothetical protein